MTYEFHVQLSEQPVTSRRGRGKTYAALKGYAIPDLIASDTRINHPTVREFVRNLAKAGIPLSPHKGNGGVFTEAYLDPTYANNSFRFFVPAEHVRKIPDALKDVRGVVSVVNAANFGVKTTEDPQPSKANRNARGIGGNEGRVAQIAFGTMTQPHRSTGVATPRPAFGTPTRN
jgi:hypothetical protein